MAADPLKAAEINLATMQKAWDEKGFVPNAEIMLAIAQLQATIAIARRLDQISERLMSK